MSPERDLFESLCRELHQTERSAILHPRREAERLAGAPPAQPFARISQHAERAVASLPASIRWPSRFRLGALFGRAFSFLRQSLVDRLIDRQRSYRGTLLGLRHGIDLVKLLRPLAFDLGEGALVAWCDGWLEIRAPLVETATRQLEWFAHHADLAGQRGARRLVSR